MLRVVVLAQLVAAAPSGPAAAVDSLAVLRSARRAQSAFEQTRRFHLPFTFDYGSSHCDERIGRFCYWNDDNRPPPAEPQRIRAARSRLLAALDSAARKQPSDEWIAGQLVRYLLEAGSPQDALRAARTCRAEPWWCASLEGLALHEAGDFAAAEAAFDRALAEMPEDERCRWTDLAPLLDGELHRRYRRMSCAERQALEARLWWLARPLLAIPGNDLRAEHFARRTMARLQRAGRLTYALSWGSDLEEILVRYGWPTAWSQARRPFPGSEEPIVVGHDRTPGFQFFPTARAVNDPAAAAPEDWALRPRRPRTQYAPAYAATFVPLEHQVAAFRRGDSIIVVAAYDLRGDTGFAGGRLEAGVALAPDPRSAVIVREPDAAAAAVLSVTAPAEPVLLSLEVRGAVGRHVARARYGLAPPPRTMSDLLLFDPGGDSLPGTLDAALSRARGQLTLPAATPIALFWEVYGADSAGELIEVSVTVTRSRASWLRRAAQSLRLAGRGASIRLQWREAARGPVSGRALALDLSTLPSGRYRITVEVRTERGESARAEREIVVTAAAPAGRPANRSP